jgi:hypothetical protein
MDSAAVAEVLSEEDAAERDARLQRQKEEAERKLLAQRSQVVQLGLPRPANVDLEAMLRNLRSGVTDGQSDQVWQLVSSELVDLLNATLSRILFLARLYQAAQSRCTRSRPTMLWTWRDPKSTASSLRH